MSASIYYVTATSLPALRGEPRVIITEAAHVHRLCLRKYALTEHYHVNADSPNV